MNIEQFKTKTVNEYKLIELRDICKNLGLAVSGKKNILYDRIVKKLEESVKSEKTIKKITKKNTKKTTKKVSKDLILSKEIDEQWSKLIHDMIDGGFQPSTWRSDISFIVKDTVNIVKTGKTSDFGEYNKKYEIEKLITPLKDISEQKLKKFIRAKAIIEYNKIGESFFDDWKPIN